MNLPLPTDQDGEIDYLLLEHELTVWESAFLIRLALRQAAISHESLLNADDPRISAAPWGRVLPTLDLINASILKSLAKLQAMGLIVPQNCPPPRYLRLTNRGNEAALNMAILMEEAGLPIPAGASWKHHRPPPAPAPKAGP